MLSRDRLELFNKKWLHMDFEAPAPDCRRRYVTASSPANRIEMRKQTRSKAIANCKSLWAAIHQSGLTKIEFLHQHPEYTGLWVADCPLCDWVVEQKVKRNVSNGCQLCPLVKQYDKTCFQLCYLRGGTDEWYKAIEGLH